MTISNEDHEKILKGMIASKLRLLNAHSQVSLWPEDTQITAQQFADKFGFRVSKVRVMMKCMGINPYGDRQLKKQELINYLDQRLEQFQGVK